MATIIKPPTPITAASFEGKPSVALFGSIEQGSAVDWQKQAEEYLKEYDINIFNPRRDNWDSSWDNSIDNPQFKNQVEWELTTLENVDVRLFYFDPNTKSPITLMELGLAVAGVGNLDTIVCCPEGYWRKGNVDIVCKRYGYNQDASLEDALFSVVSALTFYHGIPRKIHNVTTIPKEPVPIIVDPFTD